MHNTEEAEAEGLQFQGKSEHSSVSKEKGRKEGRRGEEKSSMLFNIGKSVGFIIVR